jgi:DEAD/DEAH box helicase domain-containing protein
MFVVSLLHLDPKKFGNNDAVNEWINAIDNLLPDEMAEKVKEADCPSLNKTCLYGSYKKVNQDGNKSLRQCVVVEQKAVTPPGEPLGVRIGCCLNDDEERKNKPDFQPCWNGFLRLYNYYQFLPYSYFVTTDGNKSKAYDGIKLFEEIDTDADVPKKEPAQEKWNEIKEITHEKFHGLLDLLRKNRWPIPEAGYELEDAAGEIIASAELGWEELKIAFLTKTEIEYMSKFVDSGWKVIPISEILNDPEKYMSMKDS